MGLQFEFLLENAILRIKKYHSFKKERERENKLEKLKREICLPSHCHC